jgi:hypothetical protein
MQYYTSLQNGDVNADLDAIIPVNQNNYTSYAYVYPTISIDDNSHPVTAGVTNFSGPTITTM